MASPPPGAPAPLTPGAAAAKRPAAQASADGRPDGGAGAAPSGSHATSAATYAAAQYQVEFEHRWGHLTRPHVRALAWLLDAPDLLDPDAPQWQGHIASLGPLTAQTADWLAALERDPSALEAALGARHYSRLGLYAEKLMAFYFAERGQLYAHGLQVRADRTDTVGEFDFLLREGDELVHIEFATKFYLLDHASADFNGLVGPNLADTLGAKMRKIFDKQLTLSQHPAAQPLLPQPVGRAQALVKGWLFYPGVDGAPAMQGISRRHCHGFWMSYEQARQLPEQPYAVMPRMQWLAPLKTRESLDKQTLLAALRDQPAPVMVAALKPEGDWLVEQHRGFIVPDAWRAQAAQRRHEGALPA
ncbi:DUF1853 family protein [Duganella callida]|uniref:DUF1853 family protein n=1 Tax=Duganella callida TaxID=2561932 RepID=A0A4Y9S9A9_9BURK|nr:DUF1853 family protein [Duganella callida]TFW18022.1 DUF1853 family protein [Duganella callida]